MKKTSITILLLTFISFFNCKSIQNEKEKLLIGTWSQEMRANDTKKFKFTEKRTVNFYHNNSKTNTYYYSVLDECPNKCRKYKSEWKIDYYLYLKSITDSTKVKCYEIIFEQNKDISLRYLPLEKDTYEILKRIKN